MIIGVPKETKVGERRVAVTPQGVDALVAHHHRILIEKGAGEGSGFSDQEYQKMGAEVVGVSVDSETSHKKFVDKYGLPFVLLSDKNKIVSKAFGVLGIGGLSAKRVTFIIDKEGKIRYIFPKVYVTRHSKEVINALQVLK
jgi:peroxiredoxin